MFLRARIVYLIVIFSIPVIAHPQSEEIDKTQLLKNLDKAKADALKLLESLKKNGDLTAEQKLEIFKKSTIFKSYRIEGEASQMAKDIINLGPQIHSSETIKKLIDSDKEMTAENKKKLKKIMNEVSSSIGSSDPSTFSLLKEKIKNAFPSVFEKLNSSTGSLFTPEKIKELREKIKEISPEASGPDGDFDDVGLSNLLQKAQEAAQAQDRANKERARTIECLDPDLDEKTRKEKCADK